MKELSIFVDEAGDFGDYEKHNPYYIVTMVFHNQAAEIDEEITVLNRNLEILKLRLDNFHNHQL